MQTFQTLLIEYRKAAGVSQSALARQAGVSPSYVNRLERGERTPPSREVVLRIAAALGLDAVERDRLLLSGGYAREADRAAPTEHRLYGLVTAFLEHDAVTDRDIGALEEMIELLLRSKSGSAPASENGSSAMGGHDPE